jgi:hypothetical protein
MYKAAVYFLRGLRKCLIENGTMNVLSFDLAQDKLARTMSRVLKLVSKL